tara:strand:- start:6120 stop:6371 length:252 start_codon:yes stop_codon:yes gene_type:complete
MKLRSNERLIESIDHLKAIKQQDLIDRRLTYIVPIRSHEDYIQDELMWVEEFNEHSAVVFRCMDGKRYFFNQQQLKQFKLTAR